MGDHVVVINTRKIVFTGRKWDNKIYRHHTGYVYSLLYVCVRESCIYYRYPGGLRENIANRLHEKDPTKVINFYNVIPHNVNGRFLTL